MTANVVKTPRPRPAKDAGRAGATPLWRPLALSFGSVLLLAGVAAGAIQAFGDPAKAGPKAIVRLADASGAGGPAPKRAELSDVVIDPTLDAGLEPVEPPSLLPPGSEQTPDPSAPPALPGATTVSVVTSAPDRPKPLPRAPLEGLAKAGPSGLLPVISPAGLTPHQGYRRPFVAADPKKPLIGVMVGGLGFNARATQQAIDDLPAEVTLAFVPYAKDVQGWIDKARADGHEVLIELPMEPFDAGSNDTGPQTLTVAAEPRENIARLENLLARGHGYFAVTNYQGQKFTASSPASSPVVKALKERGLGFVGAGISARAGLAAEATRAGLPFASADRILDIKRDAESIDEQLLNLEALALQNGSALGSGFAYPVTIEQLKFWTDQVADRGYILAPVSAIMDRRAAR